jgi:hypothetical protein
MNTSLRRCPNPDFNVVSRHFDIKFYLSQFQLFQIEVLGESNPLTALVVDLEDVDHDDAFSVVPYEKGAAFLWYLEELVGGPGEFRPILMKNP